MIWSYFVTVFLGFWLLAAPSAFGYSSQVLSCSDHITGLIFIVFGLFSLSKRGKIAPWIICFGGIWLQCAPLIFWAKEPVIYANDTMIGILAIAFSLLIPGLPGVTEDTGHEIPQGWTYNPSAWIQRLPIIILACVGWFISRYLGAYQLGYIDTIWDPVFGDGTRLVITSDISKSLPVPDAALGALAYTLEALLGCKGGPARWRTMPWMVVAFAFLVVPLGVVSIILVILQPLLVGAWCFLCLLAALSMLIMVVFTLDEMIAVMQFLTRSVKAGAPFWKTFWHGGDLKGTKDDGRTPPFTASPLALLKTWKWGIGFRWNLFLTALIGFGITAFGLSHLDHLVGALIVVLSIISLAEVARSLRYGLILLAVPLLIAFTPIHCIAAILLIALSIPKGPILESCGH